jgi:ribose 5-phosphate isomerase B
MRGRIAIGGDHAGLERKNALVAHLRAAGAAVEDVGAHAFDPHDDYPDFAFAVADAVSEGRAERGIIVCGSGVGACIAANKVGGVRACVCHDLYSAAQGVEHDDMNVLCLGAKVVDDERAAALVDAFLAATFDGGERFRRRLEKVLARDAG